MPVRSPQEMKPPISTSNLPIRAVKARSNGGSINYLYCKKFAIARRLGCVAVEWHRQVTRVPHASPSEVIRHSKSRIQKADPEGGTTGRGGCGTGWMRR